MVEQIVQKTQKDPFSGRADGIFCIALIRDGPFVQQRGGQKFFELFQSSLSRQYLRVYFKA